MRALTITVFCFLFINQCFSKYLLVETEDNKSSEDYEDTGVLGNIEAEVEAEVEAAVTDETPADALKNGDDYSSGPNPKILTRFLGPDPSKCEKCRIWSERRQKCVPKMFC